MGPIAALDLVFLVVAFLSGGLAKGALGIGLPLFAIPILSLQFGAADAIALNIVPILVSNVWQSFAGGMFFAVVRKFWLLILVFVVVLVPTTGLLKLLAGPAMNLTLGVAVLASVAALFARPVLVIPQRWQLASTMGVGVLAGFVGGTTSFTGLPLILYLVALRLPKDEFVASISVMYLMAGAALAIGLIQQEILSRPQFYLSLAALVPMFVGMAAGRWLRERIDQTTMFRGVLLVLSCLALGLIYRGITGVL